jgi:hypothetical protein
MVGSVEREGPGMRRHPLKPGVGAYLHAGLCSSTCYEAWKSPRPSRLFPFHSPLQGICAAAVNVFMDGRLVVSLGCMLQSWVVAACCT